MIVTSRKPIASDAALIHATTSSTTSTTSPPLGPASSPSSQSNGISVSSSATTSMLTSEGATINPKPLDIHWGALPEVIALPIIDSYYGPGREEGGGEGNHRISIHSLLTSLTPT
jgi:hypothetical protein